MEDIRKVKVGMSRTEKQIQAQQIKAQVLQEVADGSPKEMFQTLAELKAKYPSGADGTYLVIQNSDGKAHWYYWGNAWLDGGAYIDNDLSEYAKIDGSYELLTSGNALQLVNPYGNPVDKAEFDVRETYNGAEFTTGFAKLLKVKGNTRKSENLWTKGNVSKSVNGGTYVYALINNIKVKPNTTYCLSFETQIEGNSVVAVTVNSSTDGQIVGSQITSGRKSPIVITTKNDSYLIMYFYSALGEPKTGTTTYKNIMLNKGSEPLPYEPYFQGLQVIKPKKLTSVGKNLFNLDQFSMISEWNGNIKMILPKGKYTIKCYDESTLKMSVLDSSGKQLSFFAISNGSIINIAKDDLITFSIGFYGTGLTINDFKAYKMMLNVGSSALPYEPYQESSVDLSTFANSDLGKKRYGNKVNEQYQNELDLKNKVFISRVSDVITLNGSENWDNNGGTVDGAGIRFQCQTYKTQLPSSQVNLKSSWIDKSSDQTYLKQTGISINGGSIQIVNPSLKTIEQLKGWLHNNPIQLVYILAEQSVTDVSSLIPTGKYKAIGHGQESWSGANISELQKVPCEIEYQPDMAGKLAKLRTAPEQLEIDAKQDMDINSNRKVLESYSSKFASIEEELVKIKLDISNLYDLINGGNR